MGGSGVADVAVGSASTFLTLQNLIKPFIGAGILALPNAFNVGGVLASAILMAILAIGVNYCIRVLLTSVDYVYAREHGLEYDTKSGRFSAPNSDGDDESNGGADVDMASSIIDPPSRHSIQGGEDYNNDEAVALTHTKTNGDDDTPPTGVDATVGGVTTVPTLHQRKVASDDDDADGSNKKRIDPAEAEPMYTFREIGQFAYGKWGCLAVDINLVASQVGFCIAYMSFISQNMSQVFDGLTRIEWILILLGGWSLLTQIRDIRKIAFTSGFGNLIYLVSLSIIFYDGFSRHCCVSTSETSWIKVEGLALVFGTGCFALEGIGLVLPVKRAMKKKELFGSVLNIAIAFVASLYILFGVLGYLFYGDEVHSVITDNLKAGGLADAVRISLSISLFFTYAIQLFPVSEIIDELWDTRVFKVGGVPAGHETAEKYQSLDEDGETNNITSSVASPGNESPTYDSFGVVGGVHAPSHHGDVIESPTPVAPPTNMKREFALILSRIGLVGFTAIISIIFPNFGLIVSLVGSFSNSAIAFILPQIFYIKLVLKPETKRLGKDVSPHLCTRYGPFLLPYVIIVLGVAASIVGVYSAIHAMVDGDDN